MEHRLDEIKRARERSDFYPRFVAASRAGEVGGQASRPSRDGPLYPQAVFGRGADGLGANLQIDPRDRQRCERRFDLVMQRETATGFVPDIVIGHSGTWVSRGCTPGSPFCIELRPAKVCR